MQRVVSDIEAVMLNKRTLQIENAKAILLKRTSMAWALFWVPPWILFAVYGKNISRHFNISSQMFWMVCILVATSVALAVQLDRMERKVKALSILELHGVIIKESVG